MTDPLARLTRYEAAYRCVLGNDPDYYPLEVLATILSRGRSSRLYQALVEKKLALNVSAFMQDSRGPGLFSVMAMLPPGGKVEPVESAITEAIARIQADGVTPEELERAHVQLRAGSLFRLQTALGRANALSADAVYYNDPNRINTLSQRYQAVTAADVQRVARKYLNKDNRVVLITEPAPDLEVGP